MAEHSSCPHDAVCRRILGRPENAASELRSMLPESFVAQVDWATEPAKFDELLDQLEPQVKEAIVTTAEMLEARGEARGEVRGEARGEVRGKTQALLRQLGLKFGELPEPVIAKVRAAENADRDRWIDQILTATTIEEALA
ncbi:hypothetical protein [Nocardia sp. NPDC058497]|uniref:hypothetical protein n=1 Tax=Nocardia sp. NPDC058497 TaxID=3346529 RepID=UPI003661278D